MVSGFMVAVWLMFAPGLLGAIRPGLAPMAGWRRLVHWCSCGRDRIVGGNRGGGVAVVCFVANLYKAQRMRVIPKAEWTATMPLLPPTAAPADVKSAGRLGAASVVAVCAADMAHHQEPDEIRTPVQRGVGGGWRCDLRRRPHLTGRPKNPLPRTTHQPANHPRIAHFLPLRAPFSPPPVQTTAQAANCHSWGFQGAASDSASHPTGCWSCLQGLGHAREGPAEAGGGVGRWIRLGLAGAGVRSSSPAGSGGHLRLKNQ